MGAPQRTQQLLLRCLRSGGGPDRELAGLSEESWHSLVDEAMRQGVGPLVHRLLADRGGPKIPQRPADRLRDVYLHSQLRSTALLEQLDEIVSLTAEVGAPLIPLKGAHLARHVYGEPGLRPMSDLDLLVRPSDLDRVRRALLAGGYVEAADQTHYAEHHHLAPLSRRGFLDVELHRGLAPSDAPFDVDMAGIWRRTTRSEQGGTTLLQMAPDDLLLHSCTQTAFNDELRVGLIAYCDLDATVRRHGEAIDWGRLAETANIDGRSRFVYVALRLAADLLEASIPDGVWDELEYSPSDEPVVAHGAAHVFDGARDVPVTVKRLGEAETPVSRLRALASGLFPSLDELRRIYGIRSTTRLACLWYAWRPFDLLFRRGWEMAGMVSGGSSTRASREKERRRRLIRQWAMSRPHEPPGG